MTQQLICDDCGKPIDQATAYFTLSGTKVKMVEGALQVVESATQLDYHEEHLPTYKVQGEPVIPPDVPVSKRGDT